MPPPSQPRPAGLPCQRRTFRLLCLLSPARIGAQVDAEGGGTLYQLQINLTCFHSEHTDSMAFEALVMQAPDGQLAVRWQCEGGVPNLPP